MPLDEMLKNISDGTAKLVEDVKKRASTIIESAVNIAIENGKIARDEVKGVYGYED